MFRYKSIEVHYLEHDCFRINNSKVIYIDPYKISEQTIKADIVISTHEHYDHCSPEDISKVIKDETIIVASVNCKGKFNGLKVKEIIFMKPGDKKEVNGVKIEAVRAYNVNKFRAPGQVFHPREYQGIGVVVELNGVRVYHAGDTDLIDEMGELENIDIAFLPVSGTYVMTFKEASEAVKKIKPKVAIPMHYGAIVGSVRDAEKFRELSSETCEVVILEKEK